MHKCKCNIKREDNKKTNNRAERERRKNIASFHGVGGTWNEHEGCFTGSVISSPRQESGCNIHSLRQLFIALSHLQYCACQLMCYDALDYFFPSLIQPCNSSLSVCLWYLWRETQYPLMSSALGPVWSFCLTPHGLSHHGDEAGCWVYQWEEVGSVRHETHVYIFTCG